MPPKVKITKDEIIKTALEIVRKNGISELNARAISKRCGCSTQPIFSNFSSMEELYASVLEAAYLRYRRHIRSEMQKNEFPPYKASGMAYISFAKEEKELFKLLFMRDNSDGPVVENNEESMEMNRLLRKNIGLSEENASLFHLEMWIFVHGIATMSATNYLELDRELISRLLTDAYQGLKKRYEEIT